MIDSVPLLPDYRWHRIARIWRTPLLGELMMGFSFKWRFSGSLREATGGQGGCRDEFIDRVWDHFDHGTQRAILKLYRSAPEDVLAAAAQDLGDDHVSGARGLGPRATPTSRRASRSDYARALGGDAEVELLDNAGHWPWFERPD